MRYFIDFASGSLIKYGEELAIKRMEELTRGAIENANRR